MSYSRFSRILGNRDEYGNLLLPERFASKTEVNGPPQMPPFLRSTSYTSEFSSATSGSSAYASSPPTSSPSLGDLDSPGLENEARFLSTGPGWQEDPKTTLREALPDPRPESRVEPEGPPLPPPLKVVIIGSGIAGLSCAIACARQGFSVLVLERSTILSNFGDSILIGSNATLLLHRWGILDEMSEKSTKGRWWIVNDENGQELHREDLAEVTQKYGKPLLQGRRSQFTCVMDQAARLLDVDFRYDAEFTGYSDSQDKPAVMLRGGEMVRGDLIIVCDGVKSSARRLMASNDSVTVPRQPSGYAIHRAILTAAPIRADPTCSYLADGNIRFFLGCNAHAEIWPLDNTHQIAFTFTHLDHDNTSSLDFRKTTSISECLNLMTDWDPSLVQAVRKFPTTHHWQILEDSVEPSWMSKGGKIVFAGDAVHPLSPASFQAGTQAVEDGATIALCLALSGAKPETVPRALRVYERLRRSRAEEAGRLGRKQQQVLHSFVPLSRSSACQGERLEPSDYLRPLNFELYDFDAESFARQNWTRTAKEIELEELQKPSSDGRYTSRYFAEAA